MKIYYTIILSICLLGCSSSSEKSNQDSLKTTSVKKSASSNDFSGKLVLEMDGKTTEYTSMTKSGSRLSFQDKGIALYIEGADNSGKIAQIVILSPDVYGKNPPISLQKGGIKMSDFNSVQEYTEALSKTNISIKVRKIDNMESEVMITLEKGEVTIESYDDEEANILITFQGEGEVSADGKSGQEEIISISGSLELKGAYLMDTRD